MSSDNDIVADAERNANGPSPLEGAGMAQDVFDGAAKLLNGDWTEGLFNLAGGMLDVSRFRNEDPLAVLLSMGFGWVIEHVGWLREPLDWLTGEQQRLDAVAATWHGIGDEMEQAAADLEKACLSDTKPWFGPAVDSYRAFCAERVEAYRCVAAGASAVAGVVTIGKMVMAVVRTIIRNLIADFAGKLVSLLLRFPPPTTPGAAPEAVRSASAFWGRIREWLVKLKRVLGRGGEMLDNLRRHMARLFANLKANGAHARWITGLGRRAGDGPMRQAATYAQQMFYEVRGEMRNGFGVTAAHHATRGMGEKLLVETTKEAGKFATGQVDKALGPEKPPEEASYLTGGRGPHRVSGDLS